MDTQPAQNSINIIFPAFAKLANYLIEKEVDPETTGFIVGKLSRDLWTGAAAQAAAILGEDRVSEIAKDEDLERRFITLRDEYKTKTGVDMEERLNQAAQAMVDEVMRLESLPEESESVAEARQ